MNTQQLAEYFGVKRTTAQQWCREGRVIGAVKNKNGAYEIPKQPVLKYLVKTKKNYSIKDTCYDILKACNLKQHANPKDLKCDLTTFTAITESLIEQDLLRKVNPDQPAEDTTAFITTLQGAEYMKKSKREALDLLIKIISLLK